MGALSSNFVENTPHAIKRKQLEIQLDTFLTIIHDLSSMLTGPALPSSLSDSALLQRVTPQKAQQFASLLKGRLPGRSYRLLYTWSRDGRSSDSFHQRCDNQVRARAFARAAAVRLTARAGAHARHCAFHHGPHVRRLRKRPVRQCRRLHQCCGLLPVPGRKSLRQRPHLL